MSRSLRTSTRQLLPEKVCETREGKFPSFFDILTTGSILTIRTTRTRRACTTEEKIALFLGTANGGGGGGILKSIKVFRVIELTKIVIYVLRTFEEKGTTGSCEEPG